MAKATKRGKKWRCLVFSHYEYKDGKKVRKYKSFTADTRKEAERLAAVWEYDQEQSAGKLSVHDAIDQYITVKEAALSPSTVAGYRSYLKTGKFYSLEDMDVSEVDQRSLQLWVSYMLEEDYKPKYIKNCYGLLRPALTMAGIGSIPVTLPMVIMPDVYVPTDKELKQLLAYLEKEDPEVKTAAMLAAFGSMRRSEICALRPSDFRDDSVTVQRAVVRNSSGKWVEKKTNKTVKSHRTIALPAQVVSGIGFLGAGTIMVNRGHIKGLTTAAGLWASACIGLAIGTGFYEAAIVGTLAVLIVERWLKHLKKRIHRRRGLPYNSEPAENESRIVD